MPYFIITKFVPLQAKVRERKDLIGKKTIASGLSPNVTRRADPEWLN